MGWLGETLAWLRYGAGGVPESKATWTLESGRPGFSDRDNFTTNRVTVADYADGGAAGGSAAIGYSATWACVNLIAGTAASLAPAVYQKDGNGVSVEQTGQTNHLTINVTGPMSERQARETGAQVGRAARRQLNGPTR